MTAKIIIQNIAGTTEAPPKKQIQAWVDATLGPDYPDTELCIRIVDPEESEALNTKYRDKDKPTNVLSFPFEMEDLELESKILGDLVVCAEVLHEEAAAQGKALEAHWAHMIVHGTLHLLGYDHQSDAEALVMETREIEILKEFGYDNPYEVSE